MGPEIFEGEECGVGVRLLCRGRWGRVQEERGEEGAAAEEGDVVGWGVSFCVCVCVNGFVLGWF